MKENLIATVTLTVLVIAGAASVAFLSAWLARQMEPNCSGGGLVLSDMPHSAVSDTTVNCSNSL